VNRFAQYGARARLRNVPPPHRGRRGVGSVLQAALWVALLVWAAFAALGNSHGALRILGLKRDIASLKAEQLALASQRDSLEVALRSMHTPEGIERTARETYGFTREGEVLYRVQEDSAAAPLR
jgi:cell division protein FtsB